MSVQAMTWAFSREGVPSGAKFLLVAIANYADTYGVCYPGRATLARACSCTPRAVTMNMTALEKDGLVARQERRRANGGRTSDWIVLGPNAEDRSPMEDAPIDEYPGYITDLARVGENPSRGVQVGEKSSGEHSSGEKSGGTRTVSSSSSSNGQQERLSDDQELLARPKRKVVNRKQVTKQEWLMVEGITRIFNEVFKTDFDPYEHTVVTRVVMQVRAWPKLSLEKHRDILERNARAPWWGGSKPDTIGVIYSRNTFPRAMRCDGKMTKGQRRDATLDLADRLERGEF